MQGLYIGISIAVFIAIIIVLALNRQKNQRISALTMFGLTMIVLGIIFGENRWVGYSLMGVGVLFAIIDAVYVKNTEKR